MTLNVSDSRSNPNDQIAHAARVIGRSKDRIKVFETIYFGKKKIKTVTEINRKIKIPRIRILQEAKKLDQNSIVHQTKVSGDTAYEKDPFYYAHKRKILSLVRNPRKFAEFPTKVTPHIQSGDTVTIKIPRQRIQTKVITIDDIDSFKKVRKIHSDSSSFTPLLEKNIKEGIKRIFNEKGKFTDWGGEHNDLLTTRLRIGGKRYATAFSFKGRGKSGKLTPAKMGKNGDQIQRLFSSPAEVFLVQYWGQIDESIFEQMEQFAKAKSAVEDKKIFFGIIDGQDTNRIISAYPNYFRNKNRRKK
jgi:hypothetical protein